MNGSVSGDAAVDTVAVGKKDVSRSRISNISFEECKDSKYIRTKRMRFDWNLRGGVTGRQ